VLSLIALVFVVAGAIRFGSDAAAGMVVLLLGLLIGYVAIYNVQLGRARRIANQVLAPGSQIALCIGATSGALIWRGNGLMLVADAKELIAVRVPLVGSPTMAWRLELSDIDHVEVTVRRIQSTLKLAAASRSVALRTSKREAHETRQALDVARRSTTAQ
jgi:hypothetical protein